MEATNQVPDLSVLSLFLSADFIGQSVIMLLVFFSIASWAIIINKILTFKRLKINMAAFEKMFWSGQVLDELYNKVKSQINNPITQVFAAAMEECKKGDGEKLAQSAIARQSYKERILMSMQITKRKQLSKMEKSLGFLATVGSASPFIGLFGTVWGIMHSFTSIAASQNTTLAVVAPGIAEALLATAIGLFVAIPASVFYNMLISEVDNIDGRMDDFTNSLYSIILQGIDEQ